MKIKQKHCPHYRGSSGLKVVSRPEIRCGDGVLVFETLAEFYAAFGICNQRKEKCGEWQK